MFFSDFLTTLTPDYDTHSAMNTASSTYLGRKLHGQVVNELGRRIVSGHYPAGQILPKEEELGLELKVSRTALRESVKVLAAKGLLESRPRIGTRVRDKQEWNLLDPDILLWSCSAGIDMDFLRHLNELRAMIEPGAVSLAASSRTEAQLQEISDALSRMRNSKKINQWVEADLEFHTAILKATNNPLLMPLAAIIGSALSSLLNVSARSATDFKLGLPDHEKVFTAIKNGDAQGGQMHMASLLSATRTLIRSVEKLD